MTATKIRSESVSRRMAAVLLALAAVIAVVPVNADAAGDPLPERFQLHLELRYPNVIFIETAVHASPLEPLRLQREGVHDPWLAYDKALHFGVSFLITVSGQYALVNKLSMTERGALPVSSGFALSVGLGKELYDWHYGSRRFFSTRDMVANFAGVLIAGVFILL